MYASPSLPSVSGRKPCGSRIAMSLSLVRNTSEKPEAADLHLLVDPPQVLELARRAAAAPGRRSGRAARPAPDRTGPGRSAPRSGPAGRGSPRQPAPPTQISPGTPTGTGCHPRSSRCTRQVRDRPPIGLADAPSHVRPRERPVGDVDGGLGDAVHVDQPRHSSPCRSNQGAASPASSASPPKIT